MIGNFVCDSVRDSCKTKNRKKVNFIKCQHEEKIGNYFCKRKVQSFKNAQKTQTLKYFHILLNRFQVEKEQPCPKLQTLQKSATLVGNIKENEHKKANRL